jgi:hypothetical protein
MKQTIFNNAATTKTIASPFEGGGKWEIVWERKKNKNRNRISLKPNRMWSAVYFVWEIFEQFELAFCYNFYFVFHCLNWIEKCWNISLNIRYSETQFFVGNFNTNFSSVTGWVGSTIRFIKTTKTETKVRIQRNSQSFCKIILCFNIKC